MFKHYAAATISLVLLFSMVNGSRVEGQLFPVTSNLRIILSEPVGETATRVWLRVDKNRDCDFVNVHWLSANGVLAVINFEEGLVERSPGVLDLGPWVIHMTREQIRSSRATVVHQCHYSWFPSGARAFMREWFGLWRTETRIYP